MSQLETFLVANVSKENQVIRYQFRGICKSVLQSNVNGEYGNTYVPTAKSNEKWFRTRDP